MKKIKEYGKIAVAVILLTALLIAVLLEFTSAGQSAAASCIVGAP
ncbi:hypothetical protein [Chitinophaga pinensis]|nr:hypothetical protein [Chitinophaga pinensis]